tara:strand:+ start:494 stop:1402 length:909 start_codon:yes stop_codon:yes gene_type:complete
MTSHKTQELQDFIYENDDKLNKQTIKTYINDYKRFRTQMNGRQNIYNLTQKEIIDIVSKSDFNKLALLNIAIVFLKWKNKEHNRLIKYRTDLQENKAEKQAEKNMEILEKSGVDYHDLMGALDTATGSDYILFYLLIKLNTRNNDLIMKLISNKQKNLLNKEDNFMVVSPSKATYIRNDYKTAKSFGSKKDVIRDDKFQKFILKELVGGTEYLFVNNKLKPYKQTEMGKFIKARFKKYLPNSNLSQAVIYKIIQHHAEENGNVKMMKNIADARGHSINTQLTEYSTTDFHNKKAEESDDDAF